MEAFFNNLPLHNWTYQASLVLFVLAFVSYLVEMIALHKNRILQYTSSGLFVLAVVVQLWWFIDRWSLAGRAPIRTRYESLILYCLCVALVYLFLEFFNNVRIIGVFASAICAAIIVYATIHKDLEIVKLPPALQSGWFVPHVIAYFFSYAALTIAFFFSVIYLFAPHWQVSKETGFTGGGKRTTVNLNAEEMGYENIKFGFTLLTLGLILGAVWAKFAWGDYWSWDPKENWALITWLIYLTYLHVRYIGGLKGRFSAMFAVIGYVAVIFTYLFIKYLPTAQSSLHVYQG